LSPSVPLPTPSYTACHVHTTPLPTVWWCWQRRLWHIPPPCVGTDTCRSIRSSL
jgi:hypothetical protein